MIFGNNRKLSVAIDSNRWQSAANRNRQQSRALDCIRSIAIGGIRLLSIALAFSASADEPFLGGFVSAVSPESAAVRLESRNMALVAPRVVAGTQNLVSSNGLTTTAWDTTALANGWQEVTEPTGGEKAQLLVANLPSIAVEGGRLQSNTTWTSNAVHWVRNRVIVPDGVTLTVREGAIVKFGEDTGITVESGGNLNFTGKSNAQIVLTSFADDVYGGDSDFGATNAVYGTWSVSALGGGTISDAYTHVRYGTLASAPTISMPVTVTAQRTDGKARIPVSFTGERNSRFSLHWRAVDGTAKYGTDFTLNEGEAVWTSTSAETGYFEIPLVADAPDGGIKEFSVEVVSVEDASPNPSHLRTTVVIVTGNPFPSPVWAESALSEGIRLENRDPDPKPEPVPESMAIEGGRLLSNATWPTAATNFVLNAVVIPDGVTLTVITNAAVFFAPYTGIKIEKGGALRVVGSAEGPVVFSSGEKGDYAITLLEGGTFTDAYAQFGNTTVSQHPTVSIPGGCEVSERNERVQIPVSLSGDRSSAFRVKWRAVDGTAKFGEDYTLSDGEIEWTGTSQGTKYITIPIPDDGVEEESETFVVELVSAQGANLGAATRCTVLVRDGTAALVQVAVCAESASSEAVRLENRAEGTLGKAVVFGTEWKSADGATRAVAWDTTAEEDGWKDLGGAAALVRNDPSIAIEGGRLQSDTTWTSNATHLVRNTVIVPTNVTLTVVTNAVVKFCESTGIKVEAGGKLRLLGSLEENVVFTLANDDTVGGDTDMAANREWATSNVTYAVTAVSGGTISDMNAAFRGTTVESFGTASVNASTVVDGSDGTIRIPVFVSGSRTTQFSVDWKTSEGHAGRLVWAKASDGTKYIELSVADCAASFTLTLVESRGINISATANQTAVTVYRSELEFGVSAVSEASEAVRIENRADGTLGRALVYGTEYIAADGEMRAVAWDSTAVADGWQANGTLVRNDASIAIEGGRLQSNATWSPDVTHLLRNWVVVPTNVTLRIEAGTVVKFAELTGFKVEAGGKLIVAGTEENPVVYTAAADDTIGGDSDLREATPNDGDYAVNIVAGGTYTDSNCAVRYTTFSNLGTATVPAKATAALTDGIVRIPITISTDRTTKFCVDWRVAASAVPITVVTNLSGRITWNSKNDGTRYIELPLLPGTVADGFGAFTVELYESQGINISTTARRCEVAIYSNDRFPMAVSASSEESAAVRLENRDFEWSYGAPLVFGTEYIAADGETRAVAWNSTTVADGWQANGTLVRNDPSIAIEGGRLQSNATWRPDVTHLVRNWVVVPTNVTLTIAAGAVVKFCDETGIKVEAGGRLVSAGTAASDVIFTSVNDDTVGGDTDMVSEEPLPGDYAISVVSGGTFTDAFTQMRYGTSGTFGSAFLPAKVVAKKDGGIVRIPITINTSRTTPFAVDWIAYGESLGRVLLDAPTDYDDEGIISGRIEWTGSSQGTKYLEIPLDRMAATGEDESFVIELVTGLGINLNLSSSVCEVELYDTRDAFVGSSNGHAESGWCEFSAMDSSAGTGPMFAMEEVPLRYSTRWVDNGAGLTLSVADAEKKSAILRQEETAAEGSTIWNGADYEDGRYDLTHKILDADGHAVKIDSATFIVNRDVVQHAGRLSTNETWSADKVHLVVATVTVPNGVTLTIAPDAIVKFMPGASIVVEQGGLGVCKGAVLTHAYDDVMGGDTFFDGAETVPEDGGYSLSGDWEDDESTQYRYSMPLEVSGTLKGENRWPGHKTYIVTGNLTLASGATLTIEAGAVVKFQSMKMLTVNSGATLIANGTRSSPVIFTSIKDDTYGGDTNGDGNSSAAQPGDWEEIRNSGGTIKFEYVKLRYGGYGQYTNQGDAILRATGGTTTLYGCTVEQSQFRLIYRSSGTVTAQNCVFMDARTGIDGGATLVNCVIGKCNTGVASATLHNTILWACDSYGSGTFRTCLAYGDTTSVPNGVVFADPKFENAEKGDFRLKADSPCVDAGDGTVAPEKDYYNQPRQTIQTVTPTGTPGADGAYADIGIYEVQPRNAGADVDLEVKAVMAPETMTVGELVTVSWREANIGSVDTDGKWYDKVELVSANGAVVTLGMVPVVGIPAGGEKTITEASFRIPAVAEGACTIRVTANCNRDIYEGSLTANNVGLSETQTTVVVPTKGVGAFTASVVPGQSMSFKLSDGVSSLFVSDPNAVLNVSLRVVDADTGRVRIVTGTAVAGGIVLSLPADITNVQSATVTIENTSGKVESVRCEATETKCTVVEYSPTRIGNKAASIITIGGYGMDYVANATLRGNGTSVPCTVLSRSTGELAVNADGLGCRTGTYTLALELTDGSTLPVGNVEIFSNGIGPKLEAELEVPTATRANRIYTGRVVYRNVGDEDMEAPYFAVKATNAKLGFKNDSSQMENAQLDFYGIGSSHPAGVLKVGEECAIPFYFISGNSPSFKLVLATDDTDEWVQHYSLAVEALTCLNARGRTVYDAHTVDAFVQKVASNGLDTAVCGRVLTDAGAAIVGVQLSIADTNNVVVSVDRTDENGCFILDDLRPSMDYVITVTDGASAEVYQVTTPTNGDLTDVVITAYPARQVYVTLSGVPDNGDVDVEATTIEGRNLAHGTMDVATPLLMSIVVTNIDETIMFLARTESGYKAKTYCSMADLDLVNTVDIDFNTEVRITGVVRDTEGNPVSNVQVRAWSSIEDAITATTSADGRYVLNGLSEGTWTCSAYKAGYFSRPTKSVEISELVDAYTCDFVINQDVVLAQVKGSCEQCGSIGTVAIRGISNGVYKTCFTIDGEYTFTEVPYGDYTLSFIDTNGVVNTVSDNVKVEAVESVFDLDISQNYMVSIRLCDNNSSPLDGTIEIYDSVGNIRFDGVSADDGVNVSLPRGACRIIARSSGLLAEEYGFIVDGNKQIEITMKPTGFVSIPVPQFEGGNALEIYAFNDERSELLGIANASDDFVVGTLPPGIYSIVATDGELSFWQSVGGNVLVSAGTTNNVQLARCTRNLHVTITNAEQHGTELSHISVEFPNCESLNRIVPYEGMESFDLSGIPDLPVKVMAMQSESNCRGGCLIATNQSNGAISICNTVDIAATLDYERLVSIDFVDESTLARTSFNACENGELMFTGIPSTYTYVWLHSTVGVSIVLDRATFESNSKVLPSTYRSVAMRTVFAGTQTVPVVMAQMTIINGKGDRQSILTDLSGKVDWHLSDGQYRISIDGESAQGKNVTVIGDREELLEVDNSAVASIHARLASARLLASSSNRSTLKAGKNTPPEKAYVPNYYEWGGIPPCIIKGFREYAADLYKQYPFPPYPACDYNLVIWNEYRSAKEQFRVALDAYERAYEKYLKDRDAYDEKLWHRLSEYIPGVAIGHMNQDIINGKYDDLPKEVVNVVNDLILEIAKRADIDGKIKDIDGKMRYYNQQITYYKNLKKKMRRGQIQDPKGWNENQKKIDQFTAKFKEHQKQLKSLKASKKGIMRIIADLMEKLKGMKTAGKFIKAAAKTLKVLFILDDINFIYSAPEYEDYGLVKTGYVGHEEFRYGGTIDPDTVLGSLDAAYARFKAAYDKPYHDCRLPTLEELLKKVTIPTPQSCDPNEMVGPAGVGEQRYVKPGEWMDYTIYFENATNATAAAQDVYVTLPKDAGLDWTTFKLGEVVFGDNIDTTLSGYYEGESTYALPGTNWSVRTFVEHTADAVKWHLRIIDPTTPDNYPSDPYAGFLPPNDPNTHCGEGHLRFSVNVKEDATPGSVIRASAVIEFDPLNGNKPIETDPAWWNTVGSPGAAFAEIEVAVNEGETATIKVMGGSADAAASVKVHLTYNTAAAADIDLTKGEIDGETPKCGLKFPLTLTWEKGEIGEKVITIPVKTDKTVEDDEFFTLQLAEAVGMELGKERVCTVTIRDMNDKTLKTTVTPYKPKKGEPVSTNSVTVASGNVKGGFVAGTGEYTAGSKLTLTAEARPGWAFQGWRLKDGDEKILSDKAKWQVVVTNDEEYVAVFEKIPYVRGLADPADGGKVSGSGLCAAGKKVTLKASANKNFTFVGWTTNAARSVIAPYQDGDFVATTPSLVIDRSAKPAANSKTSTTITEIDGDVTYYAVFKSDPEVFAIVDATDEKGAEPTGKGAGKYVAGTITGVGKYAPGKKVTLKASANKNYVFAGWVRGGRGATALPDDVISQAASWSFEMPSNDVEYVAMFVTADEDRASIALCVNGEEMAAAGAGRPPCRTNIWAGVYLEWPVAASALSETTIKVAGLPSGLKFTDKPVTSKIGTGKTAVTVTNVPANTIYGAPTAASKTAKDRETGALTVTPSAVKFTVTTAGKSTQTYQIDTVVDALPTWAQGTFAGGLFDGALGDRALPCGTVSLTVDAKGKTSGKALVDGLTYTLAAPYYAGFEMTDGVSNFLADVTATWSYKEGTKAVKTNDVVQLIVQDNGIGGYAVAEDWFEAYTVNWKVEPWKTLGKSFDKKTFAYAILPDGSFSENEDVLTSALGEEVVGCVTLKFAATGAVTIAGEFVTGYDEKKEKYTTVKVSGSATLVPVDDEHYAVFVYLLPKGLPPHARCVEVPWPQE